MPFPVPAVPRLALYTGRPESSFSGFATSALLQATMIFLTLSEQTTATYAALGQTCGMTAADAQALAEMGILAMADYLYLRQPYASVIASPMASEVIGSYTYSKPIQEAARNAQAVEVTSEATGVVMFDLAVRMLSLRTRANGVFSGQVTGMEFKHREREEGAWVKRDRETGQLTLIGPADRDRIDMQMFDSNSELFPVL